LLGESTGQLKPCSSRSTQAADRMSSPTYRSRWNVRKAVQPVAAGRVIQLSVSHQRTRSP
jgi:hypothetical protein